MLYLEGTGDLVREGGGGQEPRTSTSGQGIDSPAIARYHGIVFRENELRLCFPRVSARCLITANKASTASTASTVARPAPVLMAVISAASAAWCN